MKDEIFSVLQRVGRSFMLPVAVLPIAGLLLGVGSSFTNAALVQFGAMRACSSTIATECTCPARVRGTPIPVW